MGNRRAIEDTVQQACGAQTPEADACCGEERGLDARTEELIAIGAALAANCQPCLRYHVRRGAEAGCTQEAMRQAVEIAHGVKATPARLLATLADRLLGSSLASPAGESACEAGGTSSAATSSGACCSPTHAS